MHKIIHKRIFCLALLSVIIPTVSLPAQDSSQKITNESGSAIESARIGPGASAMVSKGARISEEKGILSVEDPREYTGRKFEAIELRLKQLEQSQKELLEQLKQIKEALVELSADKGSNINAIN